MFDTNTISRILNAATERGDRVLLETEGFELLRAMGFRTCVSCFVRSAQDVRRPGWHSPDGDRVVVKVVSREILHKSDVGGVAIVANDPAAIAATVDAMATALRDKDIEGFTINEFVTYDAALGGELLLGLRRTDDFGPVVTVGAGGIYTEFLGENFKPGRDVAILSPALTDPGAICCALDEAAVVRLVTSPPRGQKPRLPMDRLVAAAEMLLRLGREFGHLIREFEINPAVIAGGELIALDVLVTLCRAPESSGGARPVAKIRHLLEPQSAAVIGVSERLNPGHVIVNNLLREGFDRTRLYVVKPGTDTLEGCRCYPDIAALPERVDLLVVSVAAAQVPETVAEAIEARKAESIVVIPGGLEEKSGGELHASRMRAALAGSRQTEWRGPVINGGNCLGIRSRPGRYDTMFIPPFKLSTARTTDATPRPSPVALISQSGAFGLAAADRLASIDPKYTITLGNQMDLTVGDYLTYLKDDPEIEVFAVYVEGFAPLDGVTFLKAAREIVDRGNTVVLYRAGRTPAGARASASHTASVAGDYAVTRALSRHAGAVVAESVADFEDLTRLFTFLLGRKVAGRRLGAISNAGFECVAMADNLRDFTLPAFGEDTMRRLRETFERCRIDTVVDAHNPLDLTPMADDAAYEQSVRAVMMDESIDVGIVGCVPMSPALNTLERGEGHRDDLDREDSVVQRLVRLSREIRKPWVAVVDAGALYDAMAGRLEAAGIPTFRTADRALRLFDAFCRAKCAGSPDSTMQ